MRGLYILVDKVPVEIDDVETWSRCFSRNRKRVGRTEVSDHLVSTVFLGVDHNWTFEGPPVLFETAVFAPNDHVVHMRRCATYQQAEAQHEQVVAEWQERLKGADDHSPSS